MRSQPLAGGRAKRHPRKWSCKSRFRPQRGRRSSGTPPGCEFLLPGYRGYRPGAPGLNPRQMAGPPSGDALDVHEDRFLSHSTDNIPHSALPTRPVGLGAVALYGGMIIAAIGLFLLIDRFGLTLSAPDAGAGGPAATSAAAVVPKADPVVHVLVALTAVLIAGRIVGALFRFIGQPPVIGEVVGGILLGPSFLGRVWPEAAAFILPPSVDPNLGMIAQLGVVLYMFLVGLELNPSVLRARAHATVAISHASILAPFVLGSALALFLYPRLSSRDVDFTNFALFMGVAMSITAFPVLARILTDRGIQKTPLGIIALGCAATDDVTAWCLLAFAVGARQATFGAAFLVLGLTLAYIGIMSFLVRPVAHRLLRRFDERRHTPGVAAGVLAALLTSV